MSTASTPAHLSVSPSDNPALLTARSIHDFYYHWTARGAFTAHQFFGETRITQMSEADILGHRIDGQLKLLNTPALMVHSDRAASGPKIPQQMLDLIASQDKHAVCLRGATKSSFTETHLPLTWSFRLRRRTFASTPPKAAFFNQPKPRRRKQ